jgi:hypothetical protein
MRFNDIRRAADGTEVLTGTLLHGNVRAAEMTLRIRSISGARSVVECDLLVTPSFIAPQSVVDETLRDAALSVVRTVGRRAEQKYAELAVPTPPAPTASAVAIQVDGGPSAE